MVRDKGDNMNKIYKNFSKKSSRKRAFTLAEALIAIAIIGIIAALVMQPLVQGYKKRVYSTRLKKFYSAMNQAILLYNTENSTESRYWSVPTYVDYSSTKAKVFWETYFEKYFKNVLKTEVIRCSDGSYEFWVYFTDGSSLRFSGGGSLDLCYDTNGNKSPNTLGKDQYLFNIAPTNNTDNGKFTPYIWGLGNSVSNRATILRNCRNNGLHCAQLLYLDNWEYKSDYPYKL